MGSFLNVVIARLPKRESIVYPGSRCPRCKVPINFYDNIPILSYFILRGRCRSCHQPYSIRYAVVELIMAVLSLTLMSKFGPSAEYIVYFFFVSLLLAIFWIDLDHLIIPDVLTFFGAPVGFLASSFGYLPDMDWKSSLLGLVLGACILYIPALLYEKIRGAEGLGGGDIKLLSMIGSYIGPYGVIFVLFVSSFSGTLLAFVGMVLKRTDAATQIPFGPFITAAAILYIYFGSDIIEYFNNLHSVFGMVNQ